MKPVKTHILLAGTALLAMSTSLQAQARPSLLNCMAPKSELEKKACRATTSQSCKQAAVNGVRLVNFMLYKEKINIVNVEEVQEDAKYQVSYGSASPGPDLLRIATVYVSTTPKSCHVAIIE